jgi:eukaryotic translation initiation factor 2C
MSQFVGRGNGRGDSGGRGRDSGGRGRGDSGRGRDSNGGRSGGGRDGGRGRGGGSDMPDISSLRIQSSPNLSKVVNPRDRDRSALIRSPHLPPHEPWRFDETIGTPVKLRSNFFAINPSGIPGQLYQYAFHIRKYDRSGALQREDTAHEEDYRVNIALLMELKRRHQEWEGVYFAYDSRSTIFSPRAIPLADGACIQQDVVVPNNDGTVTSRLRYQVTLTLVSQLITPSSANAWKEFVDDAVLRALNSSLLETCRQQVVENTPSWYVIGNQAFNATGSVLPLKAPFIAMRGYHASLKSCLAGLVLVCDMTVNVFLSGGSIVNILADLAGYRDAQDMIKDRGKRLSNPAVINQINTDLKNTKLKATHLGYAKKFKGLGPVASSRESEFEVAQPTGPPRMMNVADYYRLKARDTPSYAAKLPGGQLRFPFLPTINVGSTSKPTLIPMELIDVLCGQNFSHKCTGEMTATIIKYSAVPPQERFSCLINPTSDGGESVLSMLHRDPIAAAFGINQFGSAPLEVSGRILPAPRIRY